MTRRGGGGADCGTEAALWRHWTYQLEPAGAATGTGATRVTITEQGTTGPAIWRFFGHYLYGEDRSILQYLEDLGAGGG